MQGDITNNIKILQYPQIDPSIDLFRAVEVTDDAGNKKTENQYGLSADKIIKIIDGHTSFITKYNENLNFFIGKNISIKQNIDRDAPDNEVNIPYARTLTHTVKGYMYKPGAITYSLDEEIESTNQAYFDNLKAIFDENDEELKNSLLGQDQSRYGIGFEIMYLKLDEGITKPYFTTLDPKEIIPIFDYSVEKNMVCAIRYYTIDPTTEQTTNIDKPAIQVEVYYPTIIKYYELKKEAGRVTLTTNKPDAINFFQDVPINIYKNNNELLADYEPVRAMIILLDKLMSDSANELDRFAAAYLIMQNFILGGDAQDRKQKLDSLKQLRVFEIDGDGDIKFLTKEIPVEFFKEIKDSIRNDVIYHSSIPDFSDQSFGTASGIAIRYKLIGLENLCGDKEAYFKEGLERRIELINNFLKVKNIDSDVIKIKFTRNLPENITEAVDAFTKIDGKISKETALGLLPFVLDIEKEMELLKKEQEEANEMFDISNAMATGRPDKAMIETEKADVKKIS